MTDLKTIRADLGVSHKDIGDGTGVKKQYVYELEIRDKPLPPKFKGNLLAWLKLELAGLKEKRKIINKIIRKLEDNA
jgi:predicted transcriptional regulator